MTRSDWGDIHARVHRGLRVRDLLPLGTPLIAAVSGGQDSIALLKLLVDLQPKWHWSLQIVHCDHRWRGDSAENAAFVSELCQRWGVPCQVVTAVASPKTEAEARSWRYEVFGAIARTMGCTHIATGHTATDRAETLLYNLLRGSGSDGLQALTWRRALSPENSELTVVRPLLDLTRQDTAEFCQRWDLPIWPDATNQDITYARNRLRLEVMPYLQQHFNPQVESTLAQTTEILTAEVELLEQLAQELYQATVQCDPDGQTWRLRRSPLRSAPLALQRRVMRQILRSVMADSVTFHHIEKLVALMTASNRSQTDPFPGGWIAWVDGEWVILAPAKSRN